MSIITTKQLRENMSEIMSDLKNGKSVQLSYRRKIIGVLRPVQPAAVPLRRGSAAAVRNFLSTNDFGRIPRNLRASDLSFKQQMKELRRRDLDNQ